nr:hypothetical protein [Tanacetum cinerariifolium]
MVEEGDFDDDFYDLVEEATEYVEGDTVNVGGAVNTATTRVSAASSSVTTAGVSISTAKPKTPPTTTITAFEDEDLTIAQTLIKMRKLAKRLHEEELAELERRQSEIAAAEEANKTAINQELDDIQAMIKADEQMALKGAQKKRSSDLLKKRSSDFV